LSEHWRPLTIGRHINSLKTAGVRTTQYSSTICRIIYLTLIGIHDFIAYAYCTVSTEERRSWFCRRQSWRHFDPPPSCLEKDKSNTKSGENEKPIKTEGPSWSCSCGSWIYNYLCNHCLSPLMLWVRISIMVMCTTYVIKCQWLAAGRWFSLGLLVSSTNKADRYDINEILLKDALNTIKINKQTH
jgi:hypothetical protein